MILAFALALQLQISADISSFEAEVRTYASYLSGSNDEENLNRINLEALKPRFEKLGFTVAWDLKTRSFTAVKSAEKPKLRLLMLAHSDTVFERADPFQKVVVVPESDKRFQVAKKFGPLLTGPGVVDDKGGIAMMTHFLEQNLSAPVEWKVFIQGDEEIGSKFSKANLLSFAKGVDLALGFEPDWYDFEKQKPTLADRVGGNEAFSFQFMESKSLARYFGRGVDFTLAQFFQALDSLRSENLFIIASEGSWKSKRNVGAPLAEVKLNGRYRDETYQQKLHRFLEENQNVYHYQISERRDVWLPLKITSEPLIEKMKGILKDLKEPEPSVEVSLFRPASYFLAEAGVPVLEGLGPIGGDYHSNQEWLALGSFDYRMKILNALLRDLLKNQAAPR